MRYLAIALTLSITAVLPSRAALAGEPTEQLRQHVDEVIRVLEDPALKDAPEKRQTVIRRISEGIFDYADTARRALGRHWAARTPQEQAEFVGLFADLLDRAYFAKIEQYQGEKVRYADETIAGSEALVKTRIQTPRGSDMPVDYMMHRVDGRWRIHDVNIEGVSLVSNYRTQFNKIVQTESYQSLVQKLRARSNSPSASPR